jgi:AAA+ superfamily predicted ATPase
MKSNLVMNDLTALLRARNSLIVITTREEGRAERFTFDAAAAAGYTVRCWDVAQGVTEIDGKPSGNFEGCQDPGALLTMIQNRATRDATGERCAWILRDLPPWLEPPLGNSIVRQVRNLARILPTTPRERAQALILLTPRNQLPEELAGHATVIAWPIPDREEISRILDATIAGLPEKLRETAAPNGNRDAAIDAAVGLSAEEASNCFARSLVQLKRIDPALIASEKRRVIARERILEWFDPIPAGLAAVGGLENLKAWLTTRATAYTPQARAYGLPAPKGVLTVGVPGCGKSLTAKAVATAWGIPLLRVDLGALKSKFVGESESNLRRAFDVIGAIGRCVVWFDEIEKALAGATQGAADGGVSSDALGAILSWMQDRQGEAFVFATANDVEALPPELLRKGRFDEVFFVDVPTATERYAILVAALRAHGRNFTPEMMPPVAVTEGFTGAEVAAIVPDAMFAAFNDGAREIEADDLIRAARTVVPLTKTAGEKIERLRAWAKTRARPASKPETATPAAATVRALDVA